MINHPSIPADRPPEVAPALAELLGGEWLRFLPWVDSFVAMAGDDRNTTIEVYPRSRPMAPGDGEAMVQPANDADGGAGLSCFHLAVATPLSAEAVFALGAREGWRTVRLSRGGVFEVIELWIENRLMIEVLTAEMQRDYLERMTIPGWKAFLAAGPAAA